MKTTSSNQECQATPIIPEGVAEAIKVQQPSENRCFLRTEVINPCPREVQEILGDQVVDVLHTSWLIQSTNVRGVYPRHDVNMKSITFLRTTSDRLRAPLVTFTGAEIWASSTVVASDIRTSPYSQRSIISSPFYVGTRTPRLEQLKKRNQPTKKRFSEKRM